jgi:hypothetical protein
MKKVTVLAIIALAIMTITVQSCKKDSSAPATPKPTLYDSLGGTTMVTDPANTSVKIESGYLLIRNIIDSTIFVIAGDSKINSYFTVLLGEVGSGNLTGYMALSKNLSDFVAVGTGAKDFSYGGKSMTAAHDPAQNSRITMKVDSDDFTQFETDLFAGAAKAGVPSTTPALISVGRIVESLRGVVVQR